MIQSPERHPRFSSAEVEAKASPPISGPAMIQRGASLSPKRTGG
jgi:hypothetical protein